MSAKREVPYSTQVKTRLKRLLGGVPFVRLGGWKRQDRVAAGGRTDLVAHLTLATKAWQLLVSVRPSGEPRQIREAAASLGALSGGSRQVYGVLAAPFLSPRAAEICTQAGVGYVDLAGNCRLVFDRIFIERVAFPRPDALQRPLRSLFAPKATRVLRVLLEDPGRPWTLKALASEAKVSLGQAFKVKQRLLDQEFAVQKANGLRVVRPEDLLGAWAGTYSYRKSPALECYGPAEPAELEAALGSYCSKIGAPYALGLFSGAARIAPLTRYTRSFAYSTADLSELARDLGWKPVASGANFTLLTPYDEGVLYGAREIKGETVVSDLQLYLDLVGHKGRGEEAAAFILEQRLRPGW